VSLSQYVGLFSAESREHIATINRFLLALEADPSAREPVEGLFRAVHTIKGMSATLGFGSVADIAHEMEGVLEEVRTDRLPADQELIDLLFRSVDALAIAVEDAIAERASSPEVVAVVERLQSFAGSQREGSGARTAGGSGADDSSAPAHPVQPSGRIRARTYRVSAMVAANASLPGVRAYLLVQKAKELGEVSDLVPSERDLQAGAGFDGRVAFRLAAAAPLASLRDGLQSVGDLASIELWPDQPSAGSSSSDGRATGPAVTVPESRGRHIDRHVRIDADRLDSLMDQVGELVVLRDRLHRVARARGGNDLLEPVDLAARLIGELRDEVMRIRMIPIAEVLERFPRLVRDAARTLGKRVDFVVSGAEIELDRSLLGQLGDPLVHLLRNAIDHGIECPDERVSSGKPETGTIRIEAERERSRVLIRVSDDGRGIDREEVLRKAIEKEVVSDSEAAAMADEEILAMVVRAGFSTATEVTDVSGRGVGLDVVATEVRALGGTLTIESVPGEGTTFVLRLPVTVGILRAVLVGVGEGVYAIPVAHVSETVEFLAEDVHESAGRRVVFFRGEPLPLVSLREQLELPGDAPSSGTLAVVLVEISGDLVGIEVESLLGQQEIVIKPFDATRDTLAYFSGATILSDGRPALILDASSMLQQGRTPGATLPPLTAAS
jgi:two-component system, chemotaxis family, sensor kinase CheA